MSEVTSIQYTIESRHKDAPEWLWVKDPHVCVSSFDAAVKTFRLIRQPGYSYRIIKTITETAFEFRPLSDLGDLHTTYQGSREFPDRLVTET